MQDPTTEIYDRIGSDKPFYALVDAFYAGVEADPLLRPLYPLTSPAPKPILLCS